MKLSKVLLSSAVLVAAMATMFVGCKADSDGEGDIDGSKWNRTMTIDATDASKTPLTSKYRRYWHEFSSNEACAEITTTITINLDDCVLESGKASVVGFAFDYNKNATDKTKTDFNLIGINPQTRKFYVERYIGVAKQAEDSLDTDASSLEAVSKTDLEVSSIKKTNGWCNLTDDMYTIDETGKIITCVVKISQENKKYSVSLCSVKVAEYDASDSTNTKKISGTDYAVGGVLCYGNVGKGVKLVANYKTDKTDVTGTLMENVDEE